MDEPPHTGGSHRVEHLLRSSRIDVFVALASPLDGDRGEVHDCVTAVHCTLQYRYIAHITDVKLDRH